ncbi:MAG: hypothetical protein JST82_04560 [Bacteroidetes bacterium]|nr:hypothetical protein [Bacteroidota bacterium]
MIYFIPIGTTLFCIFFFIELLQHWRQHRSALHVLWWTIGIFFYGAGTVTESIHAIYGYSEVNYKAWYIFGALLGAVPLAQGTVYLILKRKTANLLTLITFSIITIGAVLVILSPVNTPTTLNVKLSGKLLQWNDVIKWIPPIVNTYGLLFMVGGAVYSAVLYYRTVIDRSKFWGNVCIATGGLLPGIGGAASRYGHIEVLYITEFIGIFLIHTGYQLMKSSSSPSIYPNQR